MQWNYVKSTPIFNESTCPEAIKNAHQANVGYYGQLIVISGKLEFIWTDTNETIVVDNSKPFYIESGRTHRVNFIEPATFRVDFYKVIK